MLPQRVFCFDVFVPLAHVGAWRPSPACRHDFDDYGRHRHNDDADEDEIDVARRKCGNTGDMSEAKAQRHDPGRPERGAENVEHCEDAPWHLSDAGGDGSEGSHDGDETCDCDGRRTEAVKEPLGAGDASAAKHTRVAAVEDSWTRCATYGVAELVSDHSRRGDRGDDHPERLADHSAEGEHAGEEEECIAGQNKADEQAGLDEHDGTDHG